MHADSSGPDQTIGAKDDLIAKEKQISLLFAFNQVVQRVYAVQNYIPFTLYCNCVCC